VESLTSFVVVVEGVEIKKGLVKIAIFDNADSYQRRKEPLRFTDMQAETDSCTWRVEGLAPGQYAVAAFQDENGNGELDKGTFGIPLEHYGFSNHPQGKLRPPSYDRAQVEYRGEAMQVDILLR